MWRSASFLILRNTQTWFRIVSAITAIAFTCIPLYALASTIIEKPSESPQTTVASELNDHPVELPSNEELLKQFTDEFNVSYTLAVAIIGCEGGLDGVYRKNPWSSAGGPWQFIDSTWVSTMKRMGLPETTPKTDYYTNLRAGAWLLSTDGSRHWNASKQVCWINKI